jgi:hypothetical protein
MKEAHMSSNWIAVFEQQIEGRPVTIWRLGTSVHLRADITRHKDVITYERQGCCVIIPTVQKQGSPLSLHVDSAEALQRDLAEQGFSLTAASDIAARVTQSGTDSR